MEAEKLLASLAHMCGAGTKTSELLTVKEACAVAKVSRWTIRRWIKKGFIRAFKYGNRKSSPVRVDAASLNEHLASSEIKPDQG